MNAITLSYGSFSVSTENLPANSLSHLVQLGFSTAIKNSIAGVKAGIIGTGATPWSDADIAAEAERIGLSVFGRDEETAKAICDAMQREMFESIVSGETRATRSRTPKLSDDDKLRRTIAIELLERWAKGKGKELPKRTKADEKEAFEALLAKALGQWSDKIESEFRARKKKLASLDLDDIM